MSELRSSIAERQNDPALLALLRAVAVSHARVRSLDDIRGLVSVTLAIAGLVATVHEAIATPVAIFGALWGLAYSAGLASWAETELKRAALLQEMFDVRLYELPWNSVVADDPLGAHEISRLERRYRGDPESLLDYYEVPDLPRPFAVLACQQQNLGWGSRVRLRYATTILCGVAAWSAAGLLVGGFVGLSVGELVLRFYVPSLGIVLLGIDIFCGQREVGLERERVLHLVRSQIDVNAAKAHDRQVGNDLLLFARQVQDVVYRTRRRQPRVPRWFYLRFSHSDRIDFQAAMDELVTTIDRETERRAGRRTGAGERGITNGPTA